MRISTVDKWCRLVRDVYSGEFWGLRAGDAEAAHRIEDKLAFAVLRHHARLGCPLAGKVVVLREEPRTRWYA